LQRRSELPSGEGKVASLSGGKRHKRFDFPLLIPELPPAVCIQQSRVAEKVVSWTSHSHVEHAVLNLH
jgi:hypothetical protein